MEEKGYAAILKALHFASIKHKNQRRKEEEAAPYINHLIEVAELLTRIGQIDDLLVLQSAILHDTLEDTQTTPDELESLFGSEIRHVVEEVTDDKNLLKEERKRLQVLHAPHLSGRAKLVKIADKISNVQAVTRTPPKGWSVERRREYLDWTSKVVDGMRGSNSRLEEYYDGALSAGLELLREAEKQSVD